MNFISYYAGESSKLYHLEPINGDNVLQESLTGYISRLAQKHLMNVAQLINYELVPVLHKKYLAQIAMNGGLGLYNNASMLNSVGQAAAQFAEALQALTLRKDLMQCTLYPWHHVIPSRRLISPIKKWCPICYEDALDKESEIYEPLIWSLQCVTACPIHGNKLITRCPYCKKEIRILDRYSKPGFCSRCKKWLGNKAVISNASVDEMAIAKQVTSILSFSDKAHHANPKHIVDFLYRCSSHFSGGMAEFARFLEIPKTTIWDWCKGKNLPPFPQLLLLCINLNVDILAVLFGKDAEMQIEIPKIIVPVAFGKKQTRHTINQDKLEEVLSCYMKVESSAPPSMQSIARSIRIPRKVIERYFPDLCKSISRRYVSFKESQATNKKEQRKVEIHKICERLIRQGVFPSRRNVEKLASWKAALRNPELQKEWKSFVYGSAILHNNNSV